MLSFARLAGIVAIPGLAASASMLSATQAQTDEVINLKQITIQIASDESRDAQKRRIDAFREATRGINSCSDADAVARKMGGSVFDRPQVRVAALPPPVRLLLASAGPDRATVPFGKAPNVRVLIQCGASRKVPSRERPST